VNVKKSVISLLKKSYKESVFKLKTN